MNRPELAAWMEQELARALPAFLPPRRWFGGKARPIAGVDFEDAAWLPHPDRACALVVVRVRDTAGGQSRYAMVLAFDRDAGELPVVGRIDGGDGPAWVTEAATDGSVALPLIGAFASVGNSELPMLRGGTIVYRDGGEVAAEALRAAPHIRQIGAEQSNTSLRVGTSLAFKLFRRLEPGENPELEIGRFLATRTSFRSMPILRGSMTYVPASGEPATLGVLQDWIESRGDGWSHMTALLRQGDEAAVTALRADAFSLGEVTEGFHRALASDGSDPAFAPEPVTASDIDLWRNQVLQRVLRMRDLIASHMASWPTDTRALGEIFLEHGRELPVRLPGVERHSLAFRKIRVHGDYHLGQTLKTASGFVLIDFEGEPAKSLAERRAKQPALRDVAGMLRSFDYAVEAAQVDAQAPGRSGPIADALRRRFLEGYQTTLKDRGPEFALADPEAVAAWIDFFELEKALYEVEYEINNRPAWVHIPLRGLVRIAGGRVDPEGG